jgi:hypothetical protein
LSRVECCPRHADQQRGKGGACPCAEKLAAQTLRAISPSVFPAARLQPQR